MILSLRRWRPRHLLAAWCAYWAALALAILGPGLLAVWRATRPGAHSRIFMSMHNGVFHASVTRGATALWTGAIHAGTLALWIAGPPLLLWLVWLLSQTRRGRGAPEESRTMQSHDLPTAADNAARALNAPGIPEAPPARPAEPVMARRRSRGV
ncbi:MAG TPA: hypothetical protein VFW98_12710 [Gemmatimonadaceae bacterium]|nr:hypothetical protein [Gemmatimonadaceae bacterium]